MLALFEEAANPLKEWVAKGVASDPHDFRLDLRALFISNLNSRAGY